MVYVLRANLNELWESITEDTEGRIAIFILPLLTVTHSRLE